MSSDSKEIEQREVLTVQMGEEDAGKRLDSALTAHVDGMSRSRLQTLIEQGQVSRAGQTVTDRSVKAKAGEEYQIIIPPPVEAVPQPEEIPLDIIFEDDDLLVINKPAGLVVHPAPGNYEGTLVNALLAHCGDSLSGIGGVKRPGIVHRLDKDTTGLMIVAKNDQAHTGLSEQLAERRLKRVYQAIVWGRPSPKSGHIETQMARHKTNRKKMAVCEAGGKIAITDYAVLKNYGLIVSLVECRLQTGRTHQIRVHMAHLQHWLVGDPVYSCPSPAKKMRAYKHLDDEVKQAVLGFPRQALHAAEIVFEHPRSGKEIQLTSVLPDDMMSILNTLENMSG